MKEHRVVLVSSVIGAMALIVAAYIQRPAAPPDPGPSEKPVAESMPAARSEAKPPPSTQPKSSLPKAFARALAFSEENEAEFHFADWRFPFEPDTLPGKIVGNDSNLVVKAKIVTPYSHTVGSWGFGFALFQEKEKPDDYFFVRVGSDGRWRFTEHSAEGTRFIKNGQLTTLNVEKHTINKAELVLLGREVLLTVNGEAYGPFDVPEGRTSGRATLLVDFEEDNPLITNSSFHVEKVTVWFLPQSP